MPVFSRKGLLNPLLVMTVLGYWSYVFLLSISVHLKICLRFSSVLYSNYLFAYIVSIVLGMEQLSNYVLELAGL